MRVRQVRAVLSLVPFIGACDRSPDHTHHLYYRSLCVIVSYIYKTLLLLSVCDSDHRWQQQSNSAERVLTPGDYPVLCLVPGPQHQSYSTGTGIFYCIIRCVPVSYLLLESDVGRLFLVLVPLPQARPGGALCLE